MGRPYYFHARILITKKNLKYTFDSYNLPSLSFDKNVFETFYFHCSFNKVLSQKMIMSCKRKMSYNQNCHVTMD